MNEELSMPELIIGFIVGLIVGMIIFYVLTLKKAEKIVYLDSHERMANISDAIKYSRKSLENTMKELEKLR